MEFSATDWLTTALFVKLSTDEKLMAIVSKGPNDTGIYEDDDAPTAESYPYIVYGGGITENQVDVLGSDAPARKRDLTATMHIFTYGTNFEIANQILDCMIRILDKKSLDSNGTDEIPQNYHTIECRYQYSTPSPEGQIRHIIVRFAIRAEYIGTVV